MTIQPTTANVLVGIAIAVATALAVGAALWLARRTARWLAKALARSFGEQVVEVMAPDMARLGNRLGQSIDDLRAANTADHTGVQGRLADVESRLAAVELELKRSPNTRTRSTDSERPEL